MKDKKSLIIYFSRADENYSVGYITKGNTEVIAEYIADITNGTLFKVEPLIPYSKDYQTAIEEAKERQFSNNASIKENIDDISEYEVIYIGAPVYWGTMPQEMFTALENIGFHDSFRLLHPTREGFTFWDYSANSFVTNLGLRIDYVYVTAQLAEKLYQCVPDVSLRKAKRTSDHTVLIAEFEE